ncbi:hypothetical protein ADK57_25800 [Streptomyces sp. MMG1533]|uniref:hypothetical protein n=1 Tax=Streptomyces sp. MMG1533 TaxID=1415546 RepID=UPI0006AF66B0|nr:hypothetical protein [Streptomyces sp. MMG1533]KOU62051.1 hypothetical protein ADK57_25800 [Streptomyces sp. MMG1533]
MPAYLVIHPRGQKRDDVLIEGDDITLTIQGSWAVLADTEGVCLAIPSGQGASIQRIDPPEELADQTGALNK